MQRVNNFLYTLIFILSINLEAEINDEFIDLYVNELPCTEAFLEYIDNDSSLREDFFLTTNEEFKILKDIFKNYCNGRSAEIINPISNRIFLGENVINKSLLYAIHSSKFAYHLEGIESLEIVDIVIDELSFINSIDIKDFGSSQNIANIILNVALGIEMFELSEFNEDFEKSSINYGSNTNQLYSLIEKFIFNTVDDTFSQESLKLIANTLFEIRIAKSNNLNYYGSPLERFSARDEIIKIYLSNYIDGNLKYFELHNLIRSKGGVIKENFLLIEPSMDQIRSLNNIGTSYEDYQSNQKGYKNESDAIFDKVVAELLVNKFDQNPEEVIANLSARIFQNRGNANCELSNQTFTKKVDTLQNDLIELEFLSYKLVCLNSQRILYDLIDKLKLFYIRVDSENLNEEDRLDALFEASVISMFLDLHMTQQENTKIDLTGTNLDLFLDKFLSLKETQVSVDKIKIISSYEDAMTILTLTQSYELLSTFILDDQNSYQTRIERLNNDLLDQITFDIELIKTNLLSDNYTKSDKIFFSNFMQMINLLLLNSVSNFVPEYLSLLIDDFKSGINELRRQQIDQLLEIMTFYIDNIDNIHRSTAPEFIFKIQPLDKWLVFKDLLSFEMTLNYVYLASEIISYDEYFELSDKRINQIISLRPDKISLEKFKSIFIEENKDLAFIDAVKKYDQIQKNYRELLESKIILSKNVYDLTAEDTASLENKYRYDLLEIQDELFDEENIGLLFKHDATTTNDLYSYLNDDEAILSFLSGEFFSVGAIQKNDYSLVVPLFLSRTGFTKDSSAIKQSFTDPNQSIPFDKLANLRASFLSDFNLDNINKLFIVTDEIFSGFPFHALYSDKNKKWLIDEYVISYLSGEKLIQYIDKRKIYKKNSFIGFGNPSLNKNNLENQIDKFFTERGDFSIDYIAQLYELPDTESELRNISKFFRKSELLFQNDATEQNVLNDLKDKYEFIAFATHSVKGMNKFYNDRGLVLTPINSNSHDDDGFLSSQEIKSLDLQNNPTILLTACNTIDSQYYLSLPYSGLASSFMEAGADGVLLSLWNVNSKSSSVLNQGIFTDNNSYFTDALRNSIIDIKSQEQFSHPYFWAPYIYLGR